ncbi:MAG: hypothetical protein KGM49_11780, partial [Sphingomonadales bacterium]|nr:hypothetical protein [Sphingomonadales bacterium]
MRNLFPLLRDKAVRTLREAQFARVARGVRQTPPVRATDDGVILFSMIGTRVVDAYLLAAKSLHARLGRGRFVVLDDGTLTAADRNTLAHHLDNPEIRPIADVAVGDCPRGGCWERLLTLLELRRDSYVIQLDSDTVTLGPLDEIAAAIDAGRNFTLKGDATSRWGPVADIAIPLDSLPDGAHVQARIEAVMHRIDAGLPQPGHYVRGCAGFAGFAPGGLSRDVADAFSREASALLGGASWSQWGSEQVMSNVIVSNEGEPLLLPYDHYMNYWREPNLGRASLVHFLGTCRYDRGMYVSAARQAIAA